MKNEQYLFEIDEHGAYRYDTLCLIPYRHHKNTLIWLVLILNECKHEVVNAIADDASEAVRNALAIYKKKIEMLSLMESKKGRL